MKNVCLWWPFLCTFSETKVVDPDLQFTLYVPKKLYCAMVMFVAIQLTTVLQK